MKNSHPMIDSLLLIGLILCFSFIAIPLKSKAAQGVAGQGPLDLMCRNKAKEVAVEAYSNCVTSYRNQRIEKIRNAYKQDLQKLKNKYDKALTDIGGTPAKQTQKTPTNPKKEETEPSEVIEVEDLGTTDSEVSI